jgi:CheY-like chemotaxis protein
MQSSNYVLVVDDDPDMVDVLIRVLTYAGYRSRGVHSGKDALEAAATSLPAIVLLDILMPVMDGWQCARELRARYGRSLAIVVLTAAEHVQLRCAEVEADGFLPKPFELSDLLSLVARYAGPPATARS